MLLPMSMAVSTCANHIQGDDKNAEQQASARVVSAPLSLVMVGVAEVPRGSSGEGAGTVGFVGYLVEFHYRVCI